jgi:hypothetical protein
MGLVSKREDIGGGRTVTRYYETDRRGRPTGQPVRTDYENPRNNRGDGGIYDGVNNGTECVSCTHGQCRHCDGKQMVSAPYETRGGGFLDHALGIKVGRKGTVNNHVQCTCCGRGHHI